MKKIMFAFAWLLAVLFSFSLQQAAAATMNDYCITPPYIGSSINPNLLLMIDNSASMYDLANTDNSNFYCANNASQSCTPGSPCGGTAYCLASATTTTPTANTPAVCPNLTDAECRVPNTSSTTDTCWTTSNKKGQCKNSTVTTTTVTQAPIQCDNQSANFCGDTSLPGHVSGDYCNNRCSVTHSCLDNTYNAAATYIGYFIGTATYSYANNKFTSGATMPGTCTYAAGTPRYLCVTSSGTPEVVTGFTATGNFLNWLTMSKLDIEKQVLTGGKYDTANQVLLAETRGCSGRKFVKLTPAGSGTANNITFAIRGGNTSGDIKITSAATEYGQTYIEIYQGSYNVADCAAAVNDWMNVNTTNLGTTQNDTKNCTGATGNASAPLVAFNQTVHDCFWYYNGHGLSNLQVIQKNCVSDWGLVSSASITSPDAPDAICSSVLDHPASPVWPSSAYGYNHGFLGLCYNGTTGNWDAAGGYDANCSYNEEADFCASIGAQTAVTDPASSTVITGTLSGVPGFVMESGLFNMPLIGTLTVKAGLATPPTGLIDKYKNLIRFGAMTFQNNGSATECNQNGYCSATRSTSCSVDSNCPSGQKCIFDVPCEKVCSVTQTRDCYLDSDCPTGETCGLLTKTDGGVILPNPSDPYVAYVGAGNCSSSTSVLCAVDSDCALLSPGGQSCVPSIGNHSSGLIQSIDNIVASSWTPFAEAFYNAMGYFARSNDYSVAVPTSRTEFNFTTPAGVPAGYDTNKNPSQKPCQKNNILIVTDGMSTADQNTASESLAALYASQVPGTYSGISGYNASGRCPSYAGSRSLPDLTWAAKNLNIKTLSTSSPASTPANAAPTHSSEYITTFVVYTGPTTSNPSAGLCDPQTFMSAAAANGGTSLFAVSNLTQLNTSLANAFDQVAARAASGTAASVLASGEGSGANLIQAVFYPHKTFTNTATGVDDEVAWVGRLTNLWYYVDPFVNNSSIREDNGCPGCTFGPPAILNPNPGSGNKTLDLKALGSPSGDYIISMHYDKNLGVTLADRWTDPLGDGVVGSQLPTISFEDLGYLWEAGTLLWQRDPGTRAIYTSCGVDNALCIPGTGVDSAHGLAYFSTANKSNANLITDLQAADSTEVGNIITWVRGTDIHVCSNAMTTTCSVDADCGAGTCLYRSRTVKLEATDPTKTPRVWKLGDVINSTPRIMSWQMLNSTYINVYKDNTYGDSGALEKPADPLHFTTTDAYKHRGMVFAGGNDGMLHAFKLGTLQLSWSGQGETQKARMINPDTHAVCASTDATPCGTEMWAFIPKNALPYLKYTADTAYCHINSVDLTPYIFDASINGAANGTKTVNSWSTVLIGGMRFGGACRNSTNTTCTDCVKTPIPDIGYSTYFALDVTDPNNPKLLWEFPNENTPAAVRDALGFTTSGPAIMRINGVGAGGVTGKDTNGNWFVVLGSGPTGPVSAADHQFLGRSDQPLQLFVLNLRDGSLLATIPTGVSNAFSGSLMAAPLDIDLDYQDEVMYVPYVKSDGGTPPSWTQGGVGRLMTLKRPDPGSWTFTTFKDGTGPVTSAVTKIYDVEHKRLWVYFGEGRYYYLQNNAADDPGDRTPRRSLFGIKDPCASDILSNNPCSDTPHSNLKNVTSNNPNDWASASDMNMDDNTIPGWQIDMDAFGTTEPSDPTTNYMAERVITDPLAGSAGVVYFTSYKPYTDLCMLGGKSFIWAVQYNTGGLPANLKGKVLVQVSTGSIEQKDLAEIFKDSRKSPAIEGKPPEMQGLSVLLAPPPVKRTVHVRER